MIPAILCLYVLPFLAVCATMAISEHRDYKKGKISHAQYRHSIKVGFAGLISFIIMQLMSAGLLVYFEK